MYNFRIPGWLSFRKAKSTLPRLQCEAQKQSSCETLSENETIVSEKVYNSDSANAVILNTEAQKSDEEAKHLRNANKKASYVYVFTEMDNYFQVTQAFLNPDLTIVDVATAISSNRTYVAESVKFVKGMTFSLYLSRLRIDKAKELFMNNRKILVSQLAERSGFNSIKTFSTVFERMEGCKPKVWFDRVKRSNTYTYHINLD